MSLSIQLLIDLDPCIALPPSRWGQTPVQTRRLLDGDDHDENRGNVDRDEIRYRGSGRCVEATPARSAPPS